MVSVCCFIGVLISLSSAGVSLMLFRYQHRGRLDDILDRYGDEDEEARDRRRGHFDTRRQMEEEDEQVSSSCRRAWPISVVRRCNKGKTSLMICWAPVVIRRRWRTRR